MPKIGQVKKATLAKTLPSHLTWEVEEAVEACPYRLGKLKIDKAVVGELTILKGDYKRFKSLLQVSKLIAVKEVE